MATTATLYPSPQLPPGTSVGAYKASGWPQAQLPPAGAPVPSADTTATVGTDGSLAFTGLTDSTDYYAGASVGGVWRYVAFNTYAASREGEQHVTVDAIAAGSTTVGSVNQGTSPWLVSENAATIPTATTMQNAADRERERDHARCVRVRRRCPECRVECRDVRRDDGQLRGVCGRHELGCRLPATRSA
jgi:hypothetical protein